MNILLLILLSITSTYAFGSECEYVFRPDEELLRQWDAMEEEARELEQRKEPRRYRLPDHQNKPQRDINGMHRRRIRRPSL